MKRIQYILVFLILLLIPANCYAVDLYKLVVPNGWQVEKESSGSGKTTVYSIFHQSKDDKDNALLIFSNPPYDIEAGTSKNIVNEAIEFYLLKYKEKQKNDPKVLKIDKKIIKGIVFSGYAVVLYYPDNTVQFLFSIHNNKTVLDGQYIGPKEKADEAINILKKIDIKG